MDVPRGGRWVRTKQLGFAVMALSLSGGCERTQSVSKDRPTEAIGPKAGKSSPRPNVETVDELYLRREQFDFSSNPALLERLKGSPHGYYRFINVVFSESVCRQFREYTPYMPTVNLHGDAHLEQYAVTSFGRGLTDFDDSSSGPAVLDLVRFGVSIRLACRNRGWGDGQDVFGEFLRGYADALTNPELEAKEPRVVARIRGGFKRDRQKFLEWCDSLMEPLSEDQRARLEKAGRRYAESIRAEHPSLPKFFFEPKAIGALRAGIGSALDEKYLVRVEGPTKASRDDVVLEVKEIRDLSGVSCIRNADAIDPFRILIGQSRIAYEPYPYLGYLTAKGKQFWVHGWADDYQELSVDMLRSKDELMEVAYDVGVQLGRGHTKQIAAPLDRQLRERQLELVTDREVMMRKLTVELTDRVVKVWRQFTSQL